jgi:hypothetical protein
MNRPPGGNRKTIRISSKIAVLIGSLMIADIIRMPFGCGTSPIPLSLYFLTMGNDRDLASMVDERT